jgi:hypothetical protein
MKNGLLMTAKAAVTILVCFFVLAGCRDKGPEDTFDPRLVGSWTNNPNDSLPVGEVKTFTINQDHSFTASIDPFGNDRGDVTGVLAGEDGKYIMTRLKSNAVSWGNQVGGYNNAEVQIVFSGNDVFFLNGDTIINRFFGGEYHRQQTVP